VALSVGGIDVMPLKRARNSALGKSETRGGGGEAGMEADKTRGKGVGEGEALASQDVDEVDKFSPMSGLAQGPTTSRCAVSSRG
jgi:hypothetical protein